MGAELCAWKSTAIVRGGTVAMPQYPGSDVAPHPGVAVSVRVESVASRGSAKNALVTAAVLVTWSVAVAPVAADTRVRTLPGRPVAATFAASNARVAENGIDVSWPDPVFWSTKRQRPGCGVARKSCSADSPAPGLTALLAESSTAPLGSTRNPRRPSCGSAVLTASDRSPTPGGTSNAYVCDGSAPGRPLPPVTVPAKAPPCASVGTTMRTPMGISETAPPWKRRAAERSPGVLGTWNVAVTAALPPGGRSSVAGETLPSAAYDSAPHFRWTVPVTPKPYTTAVYVPAAGRATST